MPSLLSYYDARTLLLQNKVLITITGHIHTLLTPPRLMFTLTEKANSSLGLCGYQQLL